MGASDHLFEEGITQYYLCIVVSLLLLGTSLFNFYKIYKKQMYFGEQGHIQNRWPFAIIPLLFGIAIFVCAPRPLNELERIKAHHAETIGETIDDEPHRNPEVKYKFTVNNKTYIAISYYPQTDFGEDIKVPGGHYKVIYNKSNPNESVMDFKIKE
ncbi:MAG: hypothetical protein M3O71_13060 [Bacteroidota bacterium]|nr:hypothetical protein [Bacteroidota bacterium]